MFRNFWKNFVMFAPDGAGAGGTGGEGSTGGEPQPQNEPNQPNQQQTEPTQQQQQQQQDPNSEPKFSQNELNQMLAREKKQGRAALARELGLNPDDKDFVKNAKKILDAQKTTEEKLQTDLTNSQKDAADATRRAELAEAKLTAISKGVNPSYVDDVITLAMAKITDEKPLETVLNELKKNYPVFFGTNGQQQQGGTGSNINNPIKQQQGGTIAERLQKSKQNPVKSSFFKNT